MKIHIYSFPYMNINPLQFYKCLADETRLKALLLIHQENELCVCELTEALQVSQPKVSRHLAQLRECCLLADRREGQWIYYRLNPDLPEWMKEVINLTAVENILFVEEATAYLSSMGERPQRKFQCC
jgi:ArsR family transcriptional regulator